jgi:hypothetical protein
MDAYSPVTDVYEAWANAFNGAIKKIVVRLTD